MPYKDLEVRRTYARNWARKLRSDPAVKRAISAANWAKAKEKLKDPKYREERNAKHRAQHAANRADQLAQQGRRYDKFKAAFEAFRAGLKCITCGSAEDIQFHHRDKKTKVQNVGSLFHSPRLFAIEIEKCDVLCRACHQEHHAKEKRHKTLR